MSPLFLLLCDYTKVMYVVSSRVLQRSRTNWMYTQLTLEQHGLNCDSISVHGWESEYVEDLLKFYVDFPLHLWSVSLTIPLHFPGSTVLYMERFILRHLLM